SRREVRQLLRDLWDVQVSLGAVVRQEQAQSAALSPIVEEAQAAVQEAAVVNVDETGWREEQRRAWLWTAVTAKLTVFCIDRSRGRAVVEALLGSAFTGVVGSGRWSAYHRFPADRRALCYAHLKRHFQALIGRGEAAALCRELTKWWPALWTFARLEGVEPTNNVSERALRPAVLWRKGSFGSDSQVGSWFAERLLTVAATCRQQGRGLLDFLVAAGE